jgi:hypothetical protein
MFSIVNVPNFTKNQINSFIKKTLIPELITVERSGSLPKGKWLNKATNRWYAIKKMPKFLLNFKRLGTNEIALIESGRLTGGQVQTYLRDAADQVVMRRIENFTEEII